MASGKKRRPTARDRDIVDALRRLPQGNHRLDIQHDLGALGKSEGAVIFWIDGLAYNVTREGK